MTDITQLARKAGALIRESDMHHAGSYTFSHEQLEQLEQLLRDKFIAELGEPMGYWRQGDNLDESDYYPAKDFPDLDTTDCTPLHALKDERT